MKRVLGIILFLILMLECNLFYLVKIPIMYELNTSSRLFLIVALCLIGMFFILNNKNTLYKMKKYNFGKYIILFLILLISEILLSKLNYNQETFRILSNGHSYLYLLVYFLVIAYIENGGEIKKIKKYIIISGIVLSLIIIFQASVINNGGNIFMKSYDIEMGGLGYRFDKIRIPYGGNIIILSYILAFGDLLNESKSNNKLLDILSIGTSVYYLIFVNQTRMAILAVGVSTITALIFYIFKGRSRFRKLTFIMILLILSVLLINSDVMNKYNSSFSDKEYNISTVARIQAYEYYSEKIFQNSGFGMGLLVPIEGTETYTLLRGNDGISYTEDVGIIGFSAIFGIWGLLWCILIIIKMIKNIILLEKNDYLQYSFENLTLSIFTSICILTTLFSINILTICMFFSDYYYSNLIKNLECNKKSRACGKES